MSFYVTTPIYYVNDLPHIGHIYTTVIADTLARYHRLRGEKVRFLTGTDEHGQKIQNAAEEQGLAPKELADRVVAHYHDVWKRMDMTHDDFIRTTDARHADGVRAIIERIAAGGDFYVDSHDGLYCTGCEAFYTEKELVDGDKCPTHERPVEKRSEENVFFRLSKYQDRLLEWYDSNPAPVQPETRRNEVRQFVASGLRDLSVSRQSFDWGIPFPGHPGHTIYVWLDALTNYISALGFGRPDTALYEQFWDGERRVRLHLIGKDILRFHAVYWPAFLMSAGLPLPTIWAHGWWLVDERKMSKSTGRVVRPDYLIDRFGADALRYFFCSEMVFGQDARVSDEAFIERYNSDLANDLGNTLSRVVALSSRAFDGKTPPVAKTQPLSEDGTNVISEYYAAMDDLAFHRAIQALRKLLQVTNQYLVRSEPWKKLKDPDALEEVGDILWNCAEAVRVVATGLLPFLPEKAPQVLQALGVEVPKNFRTLVWGGLHGGLELPKSEPLFPRIDKEAYLAELAKEAEETAEMSDEKTEETTAETTGAEEREVLEPPAERITIDDFFNIELRAATVLEAEKVPKSSKLLKLRVDAGEAEPRTLVAGIGKAYAADDLVGRQVIIVWNLQPAKLMGIESNGMVLAATVDGKPALLRPDAKVPNGTRVS